MHKCIYNRLFSTVNHEANPLRKYESSQLHATLGNVFFPFSVDLVCVTFCFQFNFYSHFSFFTSLFLLLLPWIVLIHFFPIVVIPLVDSHYYVATECYAFVFLWSQIAMLFPLFFHIIFFYLLLMSEVC